MSSRAPTATATDAATASYERFAGICAVLAVIGGLLYSVAFVILKQVTLYSVILLTGGLLSIVVFVALYNRFRASDPSFAMLGFAFGLAAGIGSAVHGAYDLANALHPEAAPSVLASDKVTADTLASLPNSVDPRGLLTFGVSGLAFLIFAWLISRSGSLPRGLGYLGYLLGLLLVEIFLARLIILDPKNPIVLYPAAATGLLISPLWYLWLGISLLRSRQSA